MPQLFPSSASRASQKRSASCGPSIGTPSFSANGFASPAWSIWPCVSSTFSIVTPALAAAASILGRSPPGSMTAARIVAVHQSRVQFCWIGVTGTMAARSGGVSGMARG